MNDGLLARLRRTPRGLAVDGDDFTRRQLGNRRHLSDETLFHLLRIQRREYLIERVVGGNPARQLQKALQPLALAMLIILDLVPAVGTA